MEYIDAGTDREHAHMHPVLSPKTQNVRLFWSSHQRRRSVLLGGKSSWDSADCSCVEEPAFGNKQASSIAMHGHIKMCYL